MDILCKANQHSFFHYFNQYTSSINFRKFNKEQANPIFMKDVEKWRLADKEVRKNLPPGVKLLCTLRGHTDIVGRIAWSQDGRMLATPSADKTVRLWNAVTGECIHVFNEHNDQVKAVSFDKQGFILASASFDQTIKLWNIQNCRPLHTLKGHNGGVNCVAFGPQDGILASGGQDRTIRLWDVDSGRLIRTIVSKSYINSVTFDPMNRFLISGDGRGGAKFWRVSDGKLLFDLKGYRDTVWSVTADSSGRFIATACIDGTLRIWEETSGSFHLSRILEGHHTSVQSVAFAFNGKLLASKDNDNTVRIWNAHTGACLAVIPELASGRHSPSLAFHPQLPLLATVGSDPGTLFRERCDQLTHIWELDFTILLNNAVMPTISYTSAKVVLVGESGVGKTGLGWRLAHGEFKEHSSTHGQQFWMLNKLSKKRRDGAQCEAVLWDLAGQPDYRLIHALFLDDADLALLLFDPTRNDDPLNDVEYWLKQLKVKTQNSRTPTILIAARSDRGAPWITQEELNIFCKQRGMKAYLLTSAKSGEGIKKLLEQMQNMIPWDDKPATVTTETFKRIKDLVLKLKEDSLHQKVIITQDELHQLLERTDQNWIFSDTEMLTAVGHLENHGFVIRLKTSQGETHILLMPELLNNLAASFVIEARRNQRGWGSLEEKRLLSGDYKFPELEKLTKAEQNILLDSVAFLFLEHNVCFRETDPLNGRTYLVFPKLINLRKPLIEDDIPIEDGVAYTVIGAVENVYASLVVLMGYTQHFIRTNQWQNHARYEVLKGFVCGFRLEEEHAGELDFVLYFGTNTPTQVRKLFQSLFEYFLVCRDLNVQRHEVVVCPQGHTLNRAIVRQTISRKIKFAFCSECGEKTMLSKADQSIHLTEKQVEEMEANRCATDQRSRFEQVLFRFKSYVTDQKIDSPKCFISYAWGNPDHEFWVERKLATDLQKAGITVLLDRWENSRIGASVPRFVERVDKVDQVIVVGTSLYRKKYENDEPMRGFVAAAEGDLIGKRMIGTEEEKESVLPVLLEGTDKLSFPPLLQSRVYADFRDNEAYFDKTFELILSIYKFQTHHPTIVELRESMSDNDGPK